MTTTPDPTLVLLAISRAKMRLTPLKGMELALAACEELRRIIEAHDIYEEAQRKAYVELIVDESLQAVFGTKQ